MSERYSKVFALSENLYATDSPIIIEAGALQKDNQTGGILAQIKMKNISAKVIKAVKVKLTLFDVAGNILADGVEQQYLDLRVVRDESFGSKSAIKLKESTTRSFAVNSIEVVFEDGSVWNGTANPWETLSNQTALINYFNDEELVKQFELTYGVPCHNVLLEEKDLWHCTCGATNKNSEEKCHKCGKSLKALKELDISALKSEKEKRLENERILAEEKAERERQEAEIAKAEFEAKKKRFKKIAAIVVPVVCVLVIGIVGIIYVANNILIPNGKYNDAVALMNSGKYEEAITAFEVLNGYKDSERQIENCHYAINDITYNDAIALIDAGNIVEAYEALITLGGYKDSAEKANSIYDKYKLQVAKAGDYLFLGAYEQDNNTSNGKEDIEWLVLEVKDGKALVISKYALDCQQYNTSDTDVTWETCTLRKWLNNDFINSAFSADEKAMIPTVTVSADKNPDYSTNPGNATQDQAFLLSITEANKYFSSDSARQCNPTKFAVANGAYVNSSGNCAWWLRSPGDRQDYVAGVMFDGSVFGIGFVGHNDVDAVRPALWISLD